VFIKYEAHVHKKEDKSKDGYTNFLCESPLYDPASVADEALPHFYEKNLDDFRETKDEGTFP